MTLFSATLNDPNYLKPPNYRPFVSSFIYSQRVQLKTSNLLRRLTEASASPGICTRDLHSAARPSNSNGLITIWRDTEFSMRWASASRGSVSGSGDSCLWIEKEICTSIQCRVMLSWFSSEKRCYMAPYKLSLILFIYFVFILFFKRCDTPWPTLTVFTATTTWRQ